MAELDPGLHQEAADASVDFCVAHGEAPLTRDQAFVAGFKAAAKLRDQRIRVLGPYVQHNDNCRSLDYEAPCNCGLDALLAGNLDG